MKTMYVIKALKFKFILCRGIPLMAGLHIRDKYSKIPLMQGGMGIGVSLSGLAGAVAAEGGIGIISIAHVGYREPDFETDHMSANLRAVKTELERARVIAGPDNGGLIGFNVMAAIRDYPEYARAAAEAGADIIVSGAGLPMDLPACAEGTSSAIAPIVSSERAARLILKRWDKKYSRTADLVVIENAHAGGHLGFSEEQLSHLADENYDESYDAEIRRIIACVREYGEKYNTDIPVVLAGGIMTAAQADHAFSLGADGIQVSTPFVTTTECDASYAFKQAYINCKKEDIEIIKSPVGMPGRAIHNHFLESLTDGGEPITHCYRCLSMCDPKTAPYCISRALIRAVRGDTENGLIFCGDNAQYLDRITTVREVISSILPRASGTFGS